MNVNCKQFIAATFKLIYRGLNILDHDRRFVSRAIFYPNDMSRSYKWSMKGDGQQFIAVTFKLIYRGLNILDQDQRSLTESYLSPTDKNAATRDKTKDGRERREAEKKLEMQEKKK